MKLILSLACAAAALAAAPAAYAKATDPVFSSRQEEGRWVRDVKRRLERRLPEHVTVMGPRQSQVLFEVAPDGTIRDAALAKASGSEAFDKAALSAVRHAKALQPPPKALAGKPVRFRLTLEKRKGLAPLGL